MKFPDEDYYDAVYTIIENALEEVEGFPAGTQIDHLGRVRYGCLLTTHIKRPFYFAFAPREMTRSTYNVPPHMKQGGKQYKAIIEVLAPNLARVKTQSGVPTIRKTLLRQPQFLPEYYSFLRKSVKGVARQIFKRASALRASGTVNARHHNLAFHEKSIQWLFGTEPYSTWFRSSDSMMSSNLYKNSTLDRLLLKAREPGFDQVQLLGRIVSQELAYRRVYDSMQSPD